MVHSHRCFHFICLIRPFLRTVWACADYSSLTPCKLLGCCCCCTKQVTDSSFFLSGGDNCMCLYVHNYAATAQTSNKCWRKQLTLLKKHCTKKSVMTTMRCHKFITAGSSIKIKSIINTNAAHLFGIKHSLPKSVFFLCNALLQICNSTQVANLLIEDFFCHVSSG